MVEFARRFGEHQIHRDKQFPTKILCCGIPDSGGNINQRNIFEFIHLTGSRDLKLSFRSAETLALFGGCIKTNKHKTQNHWQNL